MKAKKQHWPARGIPPTDETKAKLKTDVVFRLYRQRVLRRRHVLAAEQLRAVSEALVCVMYPPRDLGSSGRPKHMVSSTWIDRLPNRVRRLWLYHYTPWAHQMAEPCGSGTLLGLVEGIVVDNRGLREVEETLRIRHGSAAYKLCSALDRW